MDWIGVTEEYYAKLAASAALRIGGRVLAVGLFAAGHWLLAMGFAPEANSREAARQRVVGCEGRGL